MSIYLLDDSLKIDIFFEPGDTEFADNICIEVDEDCPEGEKIFRADETNIYLTASQARQLAQALLAAAEESADQ
jgi:hypothetical protein